MKALTVNELAAYFDHTQLKAFAHKEDFEKLCSEAAEYGFAMVAINSSPVALCKKLLENTKVHVGAAISFPLGQTTIEAKVFETKNAIENGADEIDYVINIGELKNGNWEYIKKEMESMVNICRAHQVLIKVIFENCYLEKEEITQLAKIAKEIKPDYIKTSTGFGTGGATIDDVKLMKEIVGDEVKVKAAGGIRNLETCMAMIEAGADRIGCSASVEITEAYKKYLQEK
ncbi:MAG: deoxyribose-phosphate aldolase [Eubacterium sp.]|nr:deoxyribose-phosphate aldolase [Eubacterium sp.]